MVSTDGPLQRIIFLPDRVGVAKNFGLAQTDIKLRIGPEPANGLADVGAVRACFGERPQRIERLPDFLIMDERFSIGIAARRMTAQHLVRAACASNDQFHSD